MKPGVPVLSSALWIPTAQLRWLITGCVIRGNILQQASVNATTGELRWIDVPLVVEHTESEKPANE